MTSAALDLANEIARYRPVLYGLALLQLRDRTAADDATQDTLLAALEGAPRFEGRSTLKTWLVAILRHKVIDSIRARFKRVTVPDPRPDAELDSGASDALFDAQGCWAATKDVWSDPETVVERLAFFKVLEACLTRLPEEVSAELKVSAGNLRILLYRARMQLRLCLDVGWNRP